MLKKVKLLIMSLLNAGIVAVESSSYDCRENLAIRMGCEAKDVVANIATNMETEEALIRREILRLQKQFRAEYEELRKEV